MYAMADDRISADRGKAVEAALANIEKEFWKGIDYASGRT